MIYNSVISYPDAGFDVFFRSPLGNGISSGTSMCCWCMRIWREGTILDGHTGSTSYLSLRRRFRHERSNFWRWLLIARRISAACAWIQHHSAGWASFLTEGVCLGIGLTRKNSCYRSTRLPSRDIRHCVQIALLTTGSSHSDDILFSIYWQSRGP